MTQPADPGPQALAAEARLAQALAEANRQLANVQPTLACLLSQGDDALFSDRILAQVRAFAADIASQLGGTGEGEARVAGAVLSEPAILAHLHATAIEAQVGEELAERLGLDPVLPPLLQALLASSVPQTAADAAALVEAQARFGQAQRRGELPVNELPGDLYRLAILACGAELGVDAPAQRLPASSDRIGLMRRTLESLGGEASAALDIAQAGVGLFATALAFATGMDRDHAVLNLTRTQRPRLALALLAAGLDPTVVARQLFALHPDAGPLDDVLTGDAAQAAAILGSAADDAR
jgi:hypothetical protein